MDWRLAPLETLYSEPSRNGLTRPKRIRGSGYPMINMGEIFAHERIGNIEMERVPMNQREVEQFSVKAGDLLFARQSLVAAGAGKCSVVKAVGETTTFESHLIRIRLDQFRCNPYFYFYYFLSPQGKANVQSLVMQVAAAGIRGSELAKLHVPLPPLPIQRRIAGILSAYDELIENSQRRIKILEAMARALYREWFVHFRFPGHERTRIFNGLPEGWKQTPLEEVAELRLGKMLDQQKNRGEPLPYLANVNVRWGEFDLRDLREMRFEQDELETYGLRFGDIVMCEGGEPGRCAIWKEQTPGMMIQKAIHRIRCRENMDHKYLYQSLRDQAEHGHLATLFTGATIKHLPREKLAKVTVVVPSVPLLKRFGSTTMSMEEQVETLQRKIQTLRRTRDLLLPRLLSRHVNLEA